MSRLNKRISDRRAGNPARQAEKVARAEAMKPEEPTPRFMRAKLVVTGVENHFEGNSEVVVAETLHFLAVSPNGEYPEDGSDENNTFAKFTPIAELEMYVANPSLVGTINDGDEFYVDFTKLVKPETPSEEQMQADDEEVNLSSRGNVLVDQSPEGSATVEGSGE